MASPKRGGSSENEVPKDFANVPAQPASMLDHSFTLQCVMELQKTVAELSTKTDRLITDLSKQSGKLDEVVNQISFVKGALYVIGALTGFLVVVAGWYLSGKISVGIKP